MPRRSPHARTAAAVEPQPQEPRRDLPRVEAPLPEQAVAADLVVVACSRMAGLNSLAAGTALAEMATLQIAAARPLIALTAWSALAERAVRRWLDGGGWFDTFLDNQVELAQDLAVLVAGLTMPVAGAAELIVERRRAAVVINFPDRRVHAGHG